MRGIAIVALALLVGAVKAQGPATAQGAAPAFEVATIKPTELDEMCIRDRLMPSRVSLGFSTNERRWPSVATMASDSALRTSSAPLRV